MSGPRSFPSSSRATGSLSLPGPSLVGTLGGNPVGRRSVRMDVRLVVSRVTRSLVCVQCQGSGIKLEE